MIVNSLSFSDRSRAVPGERLGLRHLRGEQRGLHPPLVLRSIWIPAGLSGAGGKEEDAEEQQRWGDGGGRRNRGRPGKGHIHERAAHHNGHGGKR